MVEPAPLTPAHRRAYDVINFSSMPVWLAMILVPRSRLTRWLVGRAGLLHVGLGAGYGALLGTGVVKSGGMIDYRDPEAVRRALAQPESFLAAWAHYVTFDLFVGQWIWQDALSRGRTARLPLLLAWMVGPTGLALHLARHHRRRS